jgi:hypothetical protein
VRLRPEGNGRSQTEEAALETGRSIYLINWHNLVVVAKLINWFCIVKNISGTKWLKFAISFISITGIVIHLIWPHLKIDLTTLGLMILGVLPWLSSLLESAKFPGGWEIKFRDLEKAASQITSGSKATTTANSEPSFITIAAQDANLALVGLRIEIEKRLRELAIKHGLPERQSLRKIFNELRQRQILDLQALSGFDELIVAGNSAAHGAKVQDAVAEWAIEYGPKILAVLDDHLNAA